MDRPQKFPFESLGFLRHTPRYSIRSSPIRPNFQMTTFKAKNVFLVLGMGHNMNKLTYLRTLKFRSVFRTRSLLFFSSSHNFADGPLLNPFFFSSHNFADGPLLGYNVTFFTNPMVMSRFFTNPMVMSRFLLILWLCHIFY